MSRILVWDLPTRLFHWLFATGVLAAFGISQLTSEHGPLFPFHMLIGLVLALMVLLRVLWGIVGTRYARFQSFLFPPARVFQYMRDTFTGAGARHIGHNPGASYAIFALLALVMATVLTGLLQATGVEFFEEVHPVFAWTTIVVVGLHVAGVVLHSVQHKENITRSMISGIKPGPPEAGIRSSRPLAALAFLLLVGFWAGGLYPGYNPVARETKLPLLGVVIPLAASDAAQRSERAAQHDDRHGGDDDD